MNGQNHEHVDLSSFWEQQTRMFEEIKRAGGFAPYAKTMPNLDEAFQSDNKLRCIDEGTPNGLRAAG
ncbi:MAG: hypothetical protein IIB81_00875, partial [Nanoarchaeota archaeon]|nr:hypothetical protein [Nanoarchaeota archaeon]